MQQQQHQFQSYNTNKYDQSQQNYNPQIKLEPNVQQYQQYNNYYNENNNFTQQKQQQKEIFSPQQQQQQNDVIILDDPKVETHNQTINSDMGYLSPISNQQNNNNNSITSSIKTNNNSLISQISLITSIQQYESTTTNTKTL